MTMKKKKLNTHLWMSSFGSVHKVEKVKGSAKKDRDRILKLGMKGIVTFQL